MTETQQAAPPADAEQTGTSAPAACAEAGITYRQLDYWARTGLVPPSVRQAAGSGSQRAYSDTDVLLLTIVKAALDNGTALPLIRAAIHNLREDLFGPVDEATLHTAARLINAGLHVQRAVTIARTSDTAHTLADGIYLIVITPEPECTCNHQPGVETIDTGELT